MSGIDLDDAGIDFLDIISILSFIVGLQNLDLNEKQVNSLMREMTDNQDQLLKKSIEQNECIISQNEEIIKLLKEQKIYAQNN